ncbi:phage tail tape measure protein [Escherichia coli]|nr:phage tail tape measure protein [Escherichia coli]
MDQIANLVIDLGIDAAEFKNEIPRIKNLLNGAASDAERSSARMQRFMERQTQAARQTTQAASSAATAASVHAQTVEKNAQAHERMAREVEKTRQRMEALSQKIREEQAQAMALAEAQDKAAAAFYRQIDSVKQASAGLQELQRIQQQIRQARNSGGIGQQDYLALISEVTAKTRVLTQAEEEATRQKVAFIRQLKEQATRQNLSSSELLRARAAQLGVSSAAEVYIRKMEQAGKATHSLGLKSAAARQEIGVLIGELARGNLGALRGSGITLANRAGWIDTLMSPRAFQDFTVDADNTAGTAEQVFSSAFSNMGNGLATFVTTGKLNFKSFTSSVLSDMAKILAQATMMKSIKGIGSVLGFDLSSLSLNANGGIYQSADLSRYSGTVVNRPTFFAFAKGAGVMGEAGPEAILPLRRGADGKLGVVADIGGSGMAMFAPQYNIEINNDGTNGQIGPAALKVVYDLGKKAAADFMQQQARDGGRLSGAYR